MFSWTYSAEKRLCDTLGTRGFSPREAGIFGVVKARSEMFSFTMQMVGFINLEFCSNKGVFSYLNNTSRFKDAPLIQRTLSTVPTLSLSAILFQAPR